MMFIIIEAIDRRTELVTVVPGEEISKVLGFTSDVDPGPLGAIVLVPPFPKHILPCHEQRIFP
jgi:hypothetical protein